MPDYFVALVVEICFFIIGILIYVVEYNNGKRHKEITKKLDAIAEKLISIKYR